MKKLIWILWAAALLAAGCGKAQPEHPDAAPADSPIVRVTVTVRRNAETVRTRTVTDEEQIGLARDVVFDCLVKSAAWEGIEASELEDCIALSLERASGGEPETYYQYDTESRHVLQMGEAGLYSIMGDEAYQKLTRLAGLDEEPFLTSAEAEQLLIERMGEVDPETGNRFSFGYVEPIRLNGRDYYLFRISWLVDNDHLSFLTEYLVAADGSELTEYLPQQ